ncbi:Aromatic acid exporter family member 1 [Geodermatophilus telluris]|uniref:Aromatic acid exporter family member 1 n=1 Tax=Geodermatophilus telluris TaxID=1190417 RepID=A0A1G6P703_9ACTN|nr:aromatic acid exporter family protein [Geodermatophilus telluris]SDC75731.1 Aromatic acid exporter family member 1 [Geodermatophilus telluris]
MAGPHALSRRLQGVLPRLTRRGRTPGLRTAKTVLAAVLAFQVATWLDTSSSPILAPLTALLVVQLTLYETLATGWERIASVTAGVLIAALFASVAGLSWWSLGLVVGISLVVGRLLRLGPHLAEVPISAMLVLAVGGAESAALDRVTETLVGAAVGVLVNLVIAPPLYVQPAGEAIAELAGRMAAVSEELAAALRGPWSRELADELLDRARGLGTELARADRRLARTEESARLNPRGRAAREAQPRLRNTLTALERLHVSLRTVSRVLLDRTYFLPEEAADHAWSPPAREALADVLLAVAATLRAAGGVADGTRPATGPDLESLTTLLDLRGRLAEALLVDPRADPAAWSQHGALLDAVDLLRVELGTALQPPSAAWAPPPLAAAQRRAVRRAMAWRRRR